MMKRLVSTTAVSLLLFAGCHADERNNAATDNRSPAVAPPLSPSPAAPQPAPAVPADADAAAPTVVSPEAGAGALPAAAPAALGLPLPPNWQGTGVLAKRDESVPKRAPAWTRIAAEVVMRDGQRLLITTGGVANIKDPSLSRSTAESRARAQLAHWTGSERVNGGMVSDVWRDPRSGETFVRAELAVPEGWVPGQPVPHP
jgi:hypothetical protein